MKPVSLDKLKRKGKIDPFRRIQSKLKFNDLFPKRKKGKCRCGCKRKVKAPRRLWATKECNDAAGDYYALIKGFTSTIRRLVYKRDHGRCANCGLDYGYYGWEADHILEVVNGGGGCGLDNFQTLCTECHKEKTRKLNKELRDGKSAGKAKVRSRKR